MTLSWMQLLSLPLLVVAGVVWATLNERKQLRGQLPWHASRQVVLRSAASR